MYKPRERLSDCSSVFIEPVLKPQAYVYLVIFSLRYKYRIILKLKLYKIVKNKLLLHDEHVNTQDGKNIFFIKIYFLNIKAWRLKNTFCI